MTIQPNPTAPQPPMPVTGAVTWTFEVVPQTNLQTFRTTIQSQNAWLPITLTMSTSMIPGNTPPAQISTQGEYDSPRGCRGTFGASATPIRTHPGRLSPASIVRCRSPAPCADEELRTPWFRSTERHRFGSCSTGYEPADWVAVFLKTYRTGETAQRVVPVSDAASPRFQAGSAIGMHALERLCQRQRRPARAVPDAGGHRRHSACVSRGGQRRAGTAGGADDAADLPPPSYVLHSSPGRVHVFWRVRGFDADAVETLQKRLARELRTRSGRDVLCANHQTSGFRESQARDAVAGHDRVPAATRPCFAPAGFSRTSIDLAGRDSERPGSARPNACHRPIAWLARSRFLQVGPARGRRTAWRPADVSHLLPPGARVSRCQMTRRSRFCRSGTRDVSRRGRTRAC